MDPHSSSNSPRTSSSRNFRRPLLIFYTFLAIFTFTYWEEIQLWYSSSNSPSSSSSSLLATGVSKKIPKSGTLNSTNETTTANLNSSLQSSSSSITLSNGTLLGNNFGGNTPFVFCGTCNYHLGDTTSCNDRVNYLLRQIPGSNPTEEVARQNLMKVGHCMEEVVGDPMKKKQHEVEEVLVDPAKKKQQEQQQQQQEEEVNADRCTFCEEGLTHPGFIVPHIGGRTCGEIRKMVLSTDENKIKNGTTSCDMIQKEEVHCCAAPVVVTVDFRKDLNVTLPMRNMRHENGTFIGAIKADFKKAIEHTRKMKARYDEVNAIPDYRARGLGWVEQRLGMVLTVAVVGDNSAAAATGEATALPAGNISIFIVDAIGDMKCGGNDNNSDELSDNWIEYHPPLTMW
eukprot:scaffold15100_cov130-Skeletonema_menzelii.AAC.1